jgi:hypothetical protein
MSAFIDRPGTFTPRLDACGCCDAALPRPELYNRPGLPTLAYRIAIHPTALRRMFIALPTQFVPPDDPDNPRPLKALSTRAGDDPAIALLDAWATVTDVLTFYQERIANEGFLRTATERGSVLELARAIGYELNPGVAASTFLAFTVEDAPGVPGVASVPEGIKIQSIPGQDQLPQTFETVEAIETRADWNVLRPRLTTEQEIDAGETQLYLKGVNTQLQPGDAILLVGDERGGDPYGERWDFRILQTVTTHPPETEGEEGYTLVTWELGLGHENPTVSPADNPRAYAFRQRAALFGHNAPDWLAMPDSVKQAYDPDYDPAHPDRRRTQWPDFEIQRADERLIDLDAVYPKILKDSWLVLERPGYAELYRAEEVTSASRTDFTLTAKTTRVKLDTGEHLSWFGLRDTVVFAQSEQLELAERPLPDPTVQGDKIGFDRLVPGLAGGRTLVVSGKRIRVRVADTAGELSLEAADGSGQSVELKPGDSLQVLRSPDLEDGDLVWHLLDRDGFAGTVASDDLILQPATEDDPVVSEVAFIDDGPDAIYSDRDRTTIILRDPLENVYDRATVTVNANVARATHGETVPDEVLGNGDGAVANQRFALKRPPLTYVSAPTPSGARSTLAVRVNGVLWQEASSLYGLGDQSQRYVVRINADGSTVVIFGDGRMGARPSTGAENVTATYRSGIGLDGLVGADTLTLLQIRPLGIRGVTNPLPTTGAADPEALEDARTNTPLTVLTLDRIVSLQDFEDFARAFAGIGKAQAVALWQGTTRLVHITVAGVDGAEVPTASELYINLVRAIDAQRDPVHPVEVASYEPRRFHMEASVLVDPRLVSADVLARVTEALRGAFAFAERAFGQPVTAAEVMKVMQEVEGVMAVDLDRLAPDDPPLPPESEQPVAVLTAGSAYVREDGSTAPAELLLINPAEISLKEMAP